jgi:hypothetical protein
MKEFLMSTTLPFWLVFIIVAAAFAATLLYMKGETKSRTLLFASAGCMLAATVLEIAIYAVLGGNSMWWCTSDEYGFWAKLVRLIPFALFIAMQILQVFFFKGTVEEHIGKELAIKSTFICLILTFPVALVLSIILGVAGVSNETLNVVVSIVFFALVLGGIGWALMRNVRTAGWRQGAAFTAFSVICVVAVCLAVFLFIVALIELFLQILTASVIVIAGIYAYSLMSKGQQVEQPKMMFRDKDGHLHVDSISRDNADKKIDERRENNK